MSCQISLLPPYTFPLLYQCLTVLFIFIQLTDKVTIQNEIHGYVVCTIIEYATINIIKPTQAISINQNVSYLLTLFFFVVNVGVIVPLVAIPFSVSVLGSLGFALCRKKM